MNLRLLFLLLLFVLAACSPEANQARTGQYFNLASFIEAQISDLDSLHPTVEKTVGSGQAQETRRISAINWTKELDLFLQSDLNKPAYRNSYQVEKKGEQTVIYRSIPGEEVTVKYLKIETDAATGKPRTVEVTMTSENYLYNSEKKLLLHCSPDTQGHWLVRDYQVSGYQQLAFFNKKPFEVKGRVL
jgi:outer membrane lipoprotein-sorting protein